MTWKHVKRCLVLQVIREIHIKTTVRYHLIIVRMTIIKKSTVNKRGKGDGKKGNPPMLYVGRQIGLSLWRTVWNFLKKNKKLKIDLVYDPAILLWACAKLLQLCPTLYDPVDCSLPCSSVPGILQATILEWVAMPSSRESSQPRNQTCVYYVSCTGGQVVYHYHLRSPLLGVYPEKTLI